MSALKDELISILPKSTNTEISLSKMDRVFMIILPLNLEPDFENIREQILTGVIIPNFDEALTRLLRHTSTTTQSQKLTHEIRFSLTLINSSPTPSTTDVG